MKNRKSFVKLLLLVALGAVIGIIGNVVIRCSETGIKAVFSEIGMAIRHTGVIVEGILILVVMSILIGIYRYLRKLWKREALAADEIADVCGEKFEYWVEIGIMISNIGAGFFLIFGCLAFPGKMVGVSVEDGIRYLVLSFVMILGCILMAVMEILFYHLMQKRDPKKKGDPSSFNFDKRWLASCDETEKLVIYQAGYKAFNSMQVIMIIGIIFSIFGKVQFGTGDFPLILLGCMWMVGMLNFGIWKMKGLRKK